MLPGLPEMVGNLAQRCADLRFLMVRRSESKVSGLYLFFTLTPVLLDLAKAVYQEKGEPLAERSAVSTICGRT